MYLGRMDHQVKIHGYRVELGEIEAALRESSGVETAIALGWPQSASGADGVVAFLGAAEVDGEAILAEARSRLPSYMVPKRLIAEPHLPLNSNGKVDRNALLARLAEKKR